MTLPLEKNLTIYKGDDFQSPTFRILDDQGVPVTLTGWIIQSQIKAKKLPDAELIASFTVTISTPATEGGFSLSLTDTQTAAISQTKGYYDVLITDSSGKDTRYVTGEITFTPTVTVKAS